MVPGLRGGESRWYLAHEEARKQEDQRIPTVCFDYSFTSVLKGTSSHEGAEEPEDEASGARAKKKAREMEDIKMSASMSGK